jgi:CubicO group peptidase (beta-lactamase class C family)
MNQVARPAAAIAARRQIITRLFYCMLFTCLWALPVRAEAADDFIARIQEIVDEEIANSDTPGASVSVVAEGRIVASVGAGIADRDRGRMVTPLTVFPAASVSKLLTATLIMRQVEHGRLNLDRSANSYLEPEYWIRDASGEPANATLRQLLSHHSGLPVSFSRGMGTKPDGSLRALSEYLSAGLQTVRPPGEKLIYSNEGFALLGYLAAQAENEDFEAHVQRVLLQPLDMTNSSFAITPDMRPNLAELYGDMFADSMALAERVDISAIGPAGSLHTTADDLARFALLHLGGGAFGGVRVLSQTSVQEMMRLQSTQHPSLTDGFGLGFGVQDEPGRRMAWWDGGLPGVSSRLALLPDYGVGIAILTNSGSPLPVHAITRRIFDLLVGPIPSHETHADENMKEVIGEYRLIDMVEPSMWYVDLLPLLSVEAHQGHLKLGSPFFDGNVGLLPLGSGRYRVSGILYDGATVLYEDGHLYMHMIEAQRVAPWGTSTALYTYAAVFCFLLLLLLGFGIFHLVRRLR